MGQLQWGGYVQLSLVTYIQLSPASVSSSKAWVHVVYMWLWLTSVAFIRPNPN